MKRLSRRQFVQGAGVAGLGLLAGCGPLPFTNQPALKVPRVGYLSPEDPARPVATLDQAFQEALRELGYVEGETVSIEWRYMAGDPDQSSRLAAELVRLPVDLIVASGNPLGRDAAAATSTIPIVLTMIADPVGAGTVPSLARPGSNITGISLMAPELHAKRLELLKATVPEVRRLLLVRQVGDPANERIWEALDRAAQMLGVEVQLLEISQPDDFGRLAAAALQHAPDGMMISTGDLVNTTLGLQIGTFALQHRLPMVCPGRSPLRAGGLLLYGPNTRQMHRRAAYYADRILKGAKPADLPVEQPREFDLVINLKTAQALGLTIPQHVLLQATEVIQ
jgi:putative ABC transport system substrate-binding protein